MLGVALLSTILIRVLYLLSELIGRAQGFSQDYINGSVSMQIASLADRMTKVETLINYVLTLIIGSVIVQVFGLLNQRKENNAASRARQHYEDDHDRDHDR